MESDTQFVAQGKYSNHSPLVSVCIITYNHEAYIAQAIESVLSQKTDFPFEIIIGEDDSSDNTRNIVTRYREQYPDKIRLLLNSRSNVIYVNGHATGRWNFIQTLSNSVGKYIAFLEGDDYWTDPLKLQSQVDFLEANPEYVLCGHRIKVVDSDGKTTQNQLDVGKGRDNFTVEDALFWTPMHPNTWVFRNFNLKNHRAYSFLLKVPAADDLMALMLLEQGRGHRINKSWSAYRQHPGGIWSTKPSYHRNFDVLQFRWVALQLFPRAGLRKRFGLTVDPSVRLLGRVMLASLASRNISPIKSLVLLSIKQNVIPTRELVMLYLLGVATFPFYVLRKVTYVAKLKYLKWLCHS